MLDETQAQAVNLPGSSVFNLLTGGSGNDTIAAGSAGSKITGGGGADSLTAGAGNDTFVYNTVTASAPASKDTIVNFAHGSDAFDFSGISGLNSLNQSVSIGVQGSAPTSIAAHSIVVVQSGTVLTFM